MSLEVDVRRTFTTVGAEPFTVEASLAVDPDETLVILGPSGSGKTLLLETIAGFHDYEGAVRHDGRDLSEVPPEDRGFGFVFQDYALFPHMTVRENVAFGAAYHDEMRDPDDLLAELGVAHLADREPPTLSGGEQQRVALARSLAIEPSALLLDEPLSALDVPTRQTLRDDLADALSDVTSIYVTHNRTTARALADRIAVMRDGQVVQTGSPEAVFESPSSPYVARFVGANCLPAAELPIDTDATQVAIRPEHVVLNPPNPDARGTVERVTREDATFRIVVALEDGRTDSAEDATVSPRIEVFTADPPAIDETIGLGFPAEHVTPLTGE